MSKYSFACLTDPEHVETIERPMGTPIEQNRICPVCSGPSRRIYHNPPVEFRGDGFTTRKDYIPQRGDLK